MGTGKHKQRFQLTAKQRKVHTVSQASNKGNGKSTKNTKTLQGEKSKGFTTSGPETKGYRQATRQAM